MTMRVVNELARSVRGNACVDDGASTIAAGPSPLAQPHVEALVCRTDSSAVPTKRTAGELLTGDEPGRKPSRRTSLTLPSQDTERRARRHLTDAHPAALLELCRFKMSAARQLEMKLPTWG